MLIMKSWQPLLVSKRIKAIIPIFEKTFAKPLHLHQIKDFSEVFKKIPQPMDPTVDWRG